MDENEPCPLCGGKMIRKEYPHRIVTLPYCEKCQCYYYVAPFTDVKEIIEDLREETD